MTIGKFSKLHQACKDVFDEELILTLNKKRYCDIEKETTLDDVLPF